ILFKFIFFFCISMKEFEISFFFIYYFNLDTITFYSKGDLDLRYLENTQYNGTYGWYNPETFQIYVSGHYDGQTFNIDQKQVLRHELLHYLHFTSTTLGVFFINNNFRELNSICKWKHNPDVNLSTINHVHDTVIKINRTKSLLTVPSYYFEKGHKYNAIEDPNTWGVITSLGSFFQNNGKRSDYNFIMHRFTLGNPQYANDAVARISLGTKYLYEHLIKFMDMMIDMERFGLEEAYENHFDNAYSGPLLPYSALALICAKNGVKALNAFILSSILSHLSLMVPFKWTNKTSGLRKYIESYINNTFTLKNYSFKLAHPSVVVEAFLQKSIELGAADINFLEMFNSNNNYEVLNNYLEKLCNGFGFSVSDLFELYQHELTQLRKQSIHPKLMPIKEKICEEVEINLTTKKDNFAKYIISPHKTKYQPFVQTDSSFIEGNLTTYEEKEFLESLIEYRDEMLRFSFERNLI
ncbi:hypothetical protein ACFW03_21865, partial [Peribacillus butanolivorans]|uniref:hypothetical protein n=1 Tax=Peribacillus butanolivorans TaxID=421767 RepID=UPI00369C6CA0